MSTINYVQNDSRPALRVRLHAGKVIDGAQPIDLTTALSVVAYVTLKGQLKDTLVGELTPGNLVSVDKKTGLWEVDEAAPYNVNGKGGIVVFPPNKTTFDKVGLYSIEYEIRWPGDATQTIFDTDQVNVRAQAA
jgi:hypothetical protein